MRSARRSFTWDWKLTKAKKKEWPVSTADFKDKSYGYGKIVLQ